MSFFLIFHKIFYKKQINEYFAEEEFVSTRLVNSVNKQMLKQADFALCSVVAKKSRSWRLSDLGRM